MRDNGQTPLFAADVGFRPDFGRRSVVLSPQHAKSGSPPTSWSTYGPNGKIEHAYLGGGSYISQGTGQILPFAADVGFRPDFGRRSSFSRPSSSNHVHHPHHDPPMVLTERLNRHIWGVEATSHKITAENLVFAGFRFRAPSAADFVLS